MNEAIVIPVSFFAFIFAMVYVFLTTRNKERMAMIERGTDPTIFKGVGRYSNFLTLKFGLLFIGAALGVLAGSILTAYTNLDNGAAYISMIFLFAGLGLVAGYWFQARKEKE